MKAFFRNPLLIKQLREEVRSRKVFFLIPIYIGLLSVVALFAVGNSSGASFNPLTLAASSRYTMFAFMITMSITLGGIATVFGAASFTTEREKATFELLELTPLSSAELIWGKFFHSYLIVLLTLIASLPVLSTLFFMGGLNYADVVLTFFYLLLFFGVVILAAHCISIIASRTLTSIILSLGIAFVVSSTFGIMSGDFYQKPEMLGFAIISPWMVIAQQIFNPIGIKLAGKLFPVWPFYTLFYVLLVTLFVAWGRNALDTRKLNRNIWARLIGLLIINLYVAVGFLCLRSFSTIHTRDMEDFFQAVLIMIMVILPCFAMGTLTDRDQIAFQKRPLAESWSPGKLLMNYPPSGLPYLILLLATSSITGALSAGVDWKAGIGYFSLVVFWIIPWFFIFTAMRLAQLRQRALFVTYVLVALLFTLVSVFQNSSKTTVSVFDFFLTGPAIVIFIVISILLLAYIQRRRKTAA